jgi:hypothetical protein
MTAPEGKAPAERTDRRERRKQPRDPDASLDWEQIVLQRVANHVRSLEDDAALGPEGSAGSRWEDAALQALRKHIQDLDSDR